MTKEKKGTRPNRLLIFSLILFSMVLGMKVTMDELAVCRVHIDDGTAGIVMAVPRLNYCFYMLQLPSQDKEFEEQSGMVSLSFLPQPDWNLNNAAISDSDMKTIRETTPCLEKFLHRQRHGSHATQSELLY